MSKDRIAYAVLMTLSIMLASAETANAVPGKLAVWLVVGVAGVNGLLRILWPSPPPQVGP